MLVDNVATFSPFDETMYRDYAVTLWTNGFVKGYRDLNELFFTTPRYWTSPVPSRWLYLLITSMSCDVTTCSYRTLANISTLSGIAVLPATWFMTRRVLGSRVAAVATAFVATSVIQLAMGRRALQDEVFALAVVLTVWAFLRVLDLGDNDRGRATYVLAALAATAAFAIKEAFLFYYVGLAALVAIRFWRTRRLADVVLIVAPPVLAAATYIILVGDIGAPLEILRIFRSASGSDVIQQYSGGPPQEIIVDFTLVAPIVTLLAIATVGSILASWRGAPAAARHLVVFTLVAAAVLALTPKDLRYSIGIDTPLRVIAAFGAATRWPLLTNTGALVVLVVLNGIVELGIFAAVFLAGGVYDPVLVNVLRALNAIPR